MLGAGIFGVGTGYNANFTPHKDLKNYSNKNEGFFVQMTMYGNYLSLAYHRDYLDLDKDIATAFGIKNKEATLSRLTLGFNAPIPIFTEENFTLAPTINYGWGGYRLVLEKEAYDKLGGSNLTKLNNKDLKFGQYIGIGLTTTFWQRLNINLSWNVNWAVHDYKAWYLITSSLVPLFIEETDQFSELMLGVSFMFGKNLQ
jgi:hypothetical protein